MKRYDYLMVGLLLLMHPFLYAETEPLRDPTQPVILDSNKLNSDKKQETEYTLQSIIISPIRRIALINAQFVKVGDRIGEDTVEAIKKNSVVLSRPGQKRTLYLFDLKNWE